MKYEKREKIKKILSNTRARAESIRKEVLIFFNTSMMILCGVTAFVTVKFYLDILSGSALKFYYLQIYDRLSSFFALVLICTVIFEAVSRHEAEE